MATLLNPTNSVFKMPDYLVEIYQQFGFDVPGHNDNDSWELPVPATFIIDQSGKIPICKCRSGLHGRRPLKGSRNIKRT